MSRDNQYEEVQILPNKEFEPSDRTQIINRRGIEQSFIAQSRGIEYFDGERENGYGGFVYDDRWAAVAKKLYKLSGLSPGSTIAQVNCEKGFLLFELQKLSLEFQLVGTESSTYALENIVNGLNAILLNWEKPYLPFHDQSIDLLIAIGYPYTLNLPNFVTFIKECNRTSRASFITLATYENESDLRIFKKWSLLGTLLYRRDEWRFLLSKLQYRGYVQFIDARFLGLATEERET